MQELQETRIRSLGHKDSLEEGMAIQPTILAWRIPWSEEPGRLLCTGLQRVRDDRRDEDMCQCLRKLLSFLGSTEIASLVAQTVKRLSTMRETWVWSLGGEDSLEKEMAPHSSTLAWKIPWTEELGAGYRPWSRKESGTTERFHFHFCQKYFKVN